MRTDKCSLWKNLSSENGKTNQFIVFQGKGLRFHSFQIGFFLWGRCPLVEWLLWLITKFLENISRSSEF